MVMVRENLSNNNLNNFLRTRCVLSNLFIPRLHQLGLRNVGSLSGLQWAAKHGHEPLVTLAISKGAKVNKITKCEYEFSVLHLAVRCKSPNPKIIRTLVKHGAQVDAKSADCCTPLYMATCNGHGQVVEELWKLGAGTKQGFSDGPSSLAYIAASRGYTDCMRAIVAAGIDFHHRENQCQTLLHAAIASASGIEIAQYLLWQEEVRITVNAKDSNGSTPLHILISHYNLKCAEKGEILRLLVQCGADVHAKDILGDTPVHIASNIEDINSFNELIHAGFNISIEGAGGDTVLQRAIRGSGRGMKFLLDLEEGTSIINVQNKKAATPLHVPAEECDRVKVELLFKYGANSDLKDGKRRTPPELALLWGNIV